MSVASPVGCARCGTILGPHFRFCPECGLPVSGEPVLSTEIAELRRRVEADAKRARDAAWRRYLLPVGATAMFVFVVVLGLVLFNNSLLNRLFPDPARGVGALPPQPRWEPQWIDVPAGVFPYDDPELHHQAEVPYAFRISKYEVSNELWLEFLTEKRRKLADLWQEAFPKNVEGWSQDAKGDVHVSPERRRAYPVTGISPVAIAEFCGWVTRRFAPSGFEIRMPTRLEWEYAARGPNGRRYSWGDTFLVQVPHAGGGHPPAGLSSVNFRVDDVQLAIDDTSPFGVVAMGTNVSEWTLLVGMNERSLDKPDEPDSEDMSAFPAVADLREALEQRELEVAWRGASFLTESQDAPQSAHPWNYTKSEVRDSKIGVGIRLVMVKIDKSAK